MELQWLAVVAASNALGALESSRRRTARMNGYASVAAAVVGYQKSKLVLLQAKEMLRSAPPLVKERVAVMVGKMEEIMLPFLLDEQAAF